MHIPGARVFILLAALCSGAQAQVQDFGGGFFRDYAQAMEQGRGSHLLDIDNDTLLMNRDDGFYSSGLRYTRIYAMQSGDSLNRFAWRIGQDLYTASDIKLPPERVGPPDHPYAGWLYLGLFRQLDRADGSALRYGLDVGCIGPCAGGEWTQKTFHGIIDQPRPRGWSKQVRNEFGVVLHGEYAPLRWRLGQSVDVTPSMHGRFGNIFTDAGVSIVARAGRLNLLPHEPTLHGYLRTTANAVGYNATLQGGYFSGRQPHAVKPQRLVGEVELGLAWAQGAWAARVAVVRRGNEIRALPESAGAQNFARLQLAYSP